MIEKLSETLKQKSTPLKSKEKTKILDIAIENIPAYNTTPERLQFHPNDRGCGYVLTMGEKKVYISGDTEDVPEMKELKEIEVAFLCMNLPYTMTVDQAAKAVRAFKPKKVYPYHSRGSEFESV